MHRSLAADPDLSFYSTLALRNADPENIIDIHTDMIFANITCIHMLYHVMGADEDSDAMCFNQPDVWKRVNGFRLWPLLHPTQRFASFTRSFG